MYTTRASQRVQAAPADGYAVLLDPEAISRWRVPAGMSAQVHTFEPREGGRFRVSLSYDAPGKTGKTSGRTDTYAGRFLTLVPDRLVVEEIEFESEDPVLGGVMIFRTELHDAVGGCEVITIHEGIPDAVSPADNETGTRMALANLAALFDQRPEGR